MIYSSNEVAVKLLLQATDAFVKNPAYPSPSYCVSFYKHAPLFCRTCPRPPSCMQKNMPFHFLMYWRPKVPNTPTRSIYIKARLSNTMGLFDYNPSGKTSLYNARAITCERHNAREITCEWHLLSVNSKEFNLSEQAAMQPFVIANDARQISEQYLWERNLQGEGTIIDDRGSKQSLTKDLSQTSLLTQTSDQLKQSRKAREDAN